MCAPSSASRHTLPVFLDQHTVSPNRMFMASNPNLNRMLEFWFYLLPPHSFSLLYRCPFIPYSWPWSCFFGNIYLVSFIPYLISVSQYINWRQYATYVFLQAKMWTACEYVYVVHYVHPLCSAHLRCSWTPLQAMSALFSTSCMCVYVCRHVCVYVCSIR